MAINQYLEQSYHIIIDEESIEDFALISAEYWELKYKAGFKKLPFSKRAISFLDMLFEQSKPQKDKPNVEKYD